MSSASTSSSIMSGSTTSGTSMSSTTRTIHLYGANIDTDVILPGKYLNLYTPEELGPHCLEGLDPSFIQRVRTGDVIIAGSNFGTGSSREHAPIAIKAAGISCIIATSFARIFYRNAINIGLPVFECADIVAAVKNGDTIEADIAKGLFTVNGAVFQAKPFPPYIQDIINAGGLVSFVRTQLKQT
jgi:3-isopropylmalate/(R)-2-methylmalate dehydratase small subunit